MKKENMNECWSILPEELTMEIFVRLPIKSLMQLKCLNKTWRKFISSSDIAILHFDRNKNKAVSHLCRTREDIHSLINDKATNLRIPSCMGPSLFQGFMPSIVGSSSNGLVCLRESQNWSRFVVWNPATRECRYLPNPENKKARPQPIGYCAGFDFRPDGVCDYKLVLVKFYHGSQNLELILRVQVFTRSTNSWKQIKDGLVPRMGYSTAIKDGLVPLDGALHSDGVSLNGSMYWSEINETFGCGIDRSPLEPQFVAFFDIWEEKFMQINGPGPCCAENYRCMKALGVVKGTLAMFISSGDSTRCFEGWVMNGQNHSWTKFFTVGPLPPICPQDYVKVLGFWLNGEIIVYDVRGSKIFLYDPRTKVRMDFPVDNYTDYNLFRYKETLFSV